MDKFSKLIEIAPDFADAYKNRGVSRMEQQKFDLAIQDFEKAKELFPELKGLHNNLGAAWFYKKDYKKAIENYDIEIKTTPENHVAYFNRALCLAELDKNKEAIYDLSQTLELEPDFYLAVLLKKDLLAKLKKNIKSTKSYEPHTKPASNKTYAIQAGAFLNPENANIAKEKLLQSGFDSRILVLQDKKERTWYLVRSGNYPNKTDARKYKLSIEEELGIKIVVRPFGSW